MTEKPTMRPTWLIEAGVYDVEIDPLLAEIRRQGMVAEVMPHQSIQRENTVSAGGRPLDADIAVGRAGVLYAQAEPARSFWLDRSWAEHVSKSPTDRLTVHKRNLDRDWAA